MPQPYSSQHASYLLNYIKSGKAKVNFSQRKEGVMFSLFSSQIIGLGSRTVLAQRKDTAVIAVELTVDEVSLGGVRHFVGLMKETSEQQEQRTLLQDTRGVVNMLSVPAVVINPQGRDRKKKVRFFFFFS